MTYLFTQDIGGSQAYHLTGKGVNQYSQSDTADTVTGSDNQSTTGTDTYTLTQTGSDSQGQFKIVLTNAEQYNQSQTMDTETGDYNRTTTGTGSATHRDTRRRDDHGAQEHLLHRHAKRQLPGRHAELDADGHRSVRRFGILH